jgi:hypothetical protein
MTEQPDMEDLAALDLDRAQESLYYAARRYCAITEQLFLQLASNISVDDPSFMTGGDAAADLAEAGQRYTEAYARFETFLPPDEPEED